MLKQGSPLIAVIVAAVVILAAMGLMLHLPGSSWVYVLLLLGDGGAGYRRLRSCLLGVSAVAAALYLGRQLFSSTIPRLR